MKWWLCSLESRSIRVKQKRDFCCCKVTVGIITVIVNTCNNSTIY